MEKLNLPGPENLKYWKQLRQWAKTHGSDGCSGVKDFYIEACFEHDFHYRYAKTFYGDPITFDQANKRFRQAIEGRSKLGVVNPLAWIRWLGVKCFGKHAWNSNRKKNEPFPERIN